MSRAEGRPVRLFVSAGEVSGDKILAATLARLRADLPDLALAGLGGPLAEAQGLKPLFPIARTAFSGAWDVLARAPYAVWIWFAAARALRVFRPDLVLLVDYPGLNLRLARLARSLRIPVHFIAPPQAWAYRDPDRKLRKARAALAGCSVQPLYAFEAGDWATGGETPATGHFQDTVTTRLPKVGPIALCPGSRLPVLRRNLPVWLRLLDAADVPKETPMAIAVPGFLAEEAARLARENAPARWAEGEVAAQTEGVGSLAAEAAGALEGGGPQEAGGLPRAGGTAAAPGLQVRTDVERVLAEAPRALAFPGTITLELARHRTPTLVLAVIDPLTYALGRRLLAGRRLSLPNLILGEDLFPEWAGEAPGPDPAAFRALWEGLPSAGEIDWEGKLDALEVKMGPGDGAEAAAKACRSALGAPRG
jgi:lipid-A-disaccharide synthase